MVSNVNTSSQNHINTEDQYVLADFKENAHIDNIPAQGKQDRSSTYSSGDNARVIHLTRSKGIRSEMNDPSARVVRHELKAWGADQTRRRRPPKYQEKLQNMELASSFPTEWFPLQVRKKSSTKTTVDYNRKGAGLWGSSWLRGKLSPLGQIPSRREAPPNPDHNTGGWQHPEWTLPDKPRPPGRKAAPRRQDPHRLRANAIVLERKVTKPQTRKILAPRSATGNLRKIAGDSQTALPTPQFSALVATKRASAWARSPSRDTAGGILVKHSFFYGSGGRGPLQGGMTASPSFESQWMRKFREEVQSNPYWWAGPDHQSSKKLGTSLWGIQRVKELDGASVFVPSANALTPREKGTPSQPADLWREVRALLAAGKRGDETNPEDGGDHGEDDGRAIACERTNALLFDDRLRHTPLSQGAWLEDRTKEGQSISESSVPHPGGFCVAAREEGRSTVRSMTPAGVAQYSEAGAKESSRTIQQLSIGCTPEHETLIGVREDGDANTEANSKIGSRKNLQSAHDALLARLRGKIDSVTREEIVSRAAEDARGALARDQTRVTPSRLASVSLSRASSAKESVSIPDSIDYDKVEATLSLIELASRAAGPDAGRQMLRALEGLDKIHQHLSADKITEKEFETAPTNNGGLDQEDPFDVKTTRNLMVTAIARGGSTAKDNPEETRTCSPTADQTLLETVAKAAAMEEGTPHQLSRKDLAAVSVLSNELISSETQSGVIHSIGNCLWGTARLPPRKSSSGSGSTGTLRDEGHRRGSGKEGFVSFGKPGTDKYPDIAAVAARRSGEQQNEKSAQVRCEIANPQERGEGEAVRPCLVVKNNGRKVEIDGSNELGPKEMFQEAELGTCVSREAIIPSFSPARVDPNSSRGATKESRKTASSTLQTNRPARSKMSPNCCRDADPPPEKALVGDLRSQPTTEIKKSRNLFKREFRPTKTDCAPIAPTTSGKATRKIRSSTWDQINISDSKSTDHRDSWVVIGARPRRMKESQIVAPECRGEEGAAEENMLVKEIAGPSSTISPGKDTSAGNRRVYASRGSLNDR